MTLVNLPLIVLVGGLAFIGLWSSLSWIVRTARFLSALWKKWPETVSVSDALERQLDQETLDKAYPNSLYGKFGNVPEPGPAPSENEALIEEANSQGGDAMAEAINDLKNEEASQGLKADLSENQALASAPLEEAAQGLEAVAAQAISFAEKEKEELERLSGTDYRKSLMEFKQYLDQGRGVRAENAYGVEVDLLSFSIIKATSGVNGEMVDIPTINVKVVKLQPRELLTSPWALPREGQNLSLDPNWPHWKLTSLYGKEAQASVSP
jgi:hypothetical protein